eukprot:5913178-Amphidinium_carterae.1
MATRKCSRRSEQHPRRGSRAQSPTRPDITSTLADAASGRPAAACSTAAGAAAVGSTAGSAPVAAAATVQPQAAIGDSNNKGGGCPKPPAYSLGLFEYEKF